MMGRLNHDQEQFFYSFRLDEAVPDDHPVREIAAVLDLSWVHSELVHHYPRLGRPSIDPVLMIRMLIIGYVFAIRSERALCRDVRVNLAYRWFCGLSIEDKIPDHSAFSRARNERFRDSDIFRSVFERVVGACIGAGLVGGEGFAVDASLIVADANKQRSIRGAHWNRELDAETVSRATKEYLATLDDAAFGAASDVTPKFVSPSDPAAQWTGATHGPAFFAYSDNYLIDVKSGIIMDVEASRAIRQAEVGAAKTMIERTEQRFAIKPERLAGDTAYGSGANLNWLVNEVKIAPHIPVDDKSKREDGTFSREDFSFDKERNVYICPAGKVLTTTGKLVNDGETLLYRAKTRDCRSCLLKAQCCPKVPLRRIPRNVYEEARDVARALAKTEAFERSRRDRKRVEMLFAHLKRIFRFGRLRLRGPCGAQFEFTMAAIAQNLRRLAKLVVRPPPVTEACFA
ncbi:MAG: IS1182 family transposase [Xanthobacteraceae bacterium]